FLGRVPDHLQLAELVVTPANAGPANADRVPNVVALRFPRSSPRFRSEPGATRYFAGMRDDDRPQSKRPRALVEQRPQGIGSLAGHGAVDGSWDPDALHPDQVVGLVRAKRMSRGNAERGSQVEIEREELQGLRRSQRGSRRPQDRGRRA